MWPAGRTPFHHGLDRVNRARARGFAREARLRVAAELLLVAKNKQLMLHVCALVACACMLHVQLLVAKNQQQLLLVATCCNMLQSTSNCCFATCCKAQAIATSSRTPVVFCNKQQQQATPAVYCRASCGKPGQANRAMVLTIECLLVLVAHAKPAVGCRE